MSAFAVDEHQTVIRAQTPQFGRQGQIGGVVAEGLRGEGGNVLR
jgi:hypothetical protein